MLRRSATSEPRREAIRVRSLGDISTWNTSNRPHSGDESTILFASYAAVLQECWRWPGSSRPSPQRSNIRVPNASEMPMDSRSTRDPGPPPKNFQTLLRREHIGRSAVSARPKCFSSDIRWPAARIESRMNAGQSPTAGADDRRRAARSLHDSVVIQKVMNLVPARPHISLRGNRGYAVSHAVADLPMRQAASGSGSRIVPAL